MLINASISNYKSINKTQNINMLAVGSEKDNINKKNVIEGGERLLKSALIFGANASGKSNFLTAVSFMKEMLFDSVKDISSNIAAKAIPFLLDASNIKKPTEIEVVFIYEKLKYRYGLSILQGKVKEEWLYYTPSIRETKLFERDGMNVTINKSSFSEAEKFIDQESSTILKTRDNVPFVSVLASFNGSHSSNVISWFNKLNVISGIQEAGFKNFTMNLIRESEEFNSWAVDVLKSFQISGLSVEEVELKDVLAKVSSNNKSMNKILEGVKEFQGEKNYTIKIKKKMKKGEIEFPISFESEGTKKVIYLLGPIYDSIVNGKVLFIDEFDSKFHTLLSKYLFKLFNSDFNSSSQMVCVVQDANLMSTDIFRRDQIWFVDKSEGGNSSLYSLVEFKEKNRTLRKEYGDKYLKGNYDAIPLFDDCDFIESIMDDDDVRSDYGEE